MLNWYRRYKQNLQLHCGGFDKHEESLPEVGNIYVITDWYGIAKAIVETTKVEQIPFNQMNENYAMIEGEGDANLADWKKHIGNITLEKWNLLVRKQVKIC